MNTSEAVYQNIVKSFLGCELSEISNEYDIFKGSKEYDPEEMYRIPKEVQVLLTINNLESPELSYGYVVFGIYKGRKIVFQQDASPLMVYYKNLPKDNTA
jgi:hypothetical protein